MFTDAATRSGPFSNLPALNNILAHETSNYQLSGQTTGVDPITAINFTDETQAGGPGTTDIQLTFANPLVDDVYTLSIFDTLMNDAGNKLDGEVTAASGGTNTIVLPSGNGVPGGNFVATFAVQANTELAVAMTQGVQFFNLQTVGMAGTTMTAPFGNPSDILFTGNFANPTTGLADGFSKLAAYGEDNGQFRFLFQSDNGGPTTSVVSPLQIPALPVAGDFDGNASNGAEVGLYTGSDWYLFSHDFSSYEVIPWSHPGLPVVGDFDGDGLPDLATWSDGAFYVALSSAQDNYQVNVIIPFNLPSATVRPVAADINGDGIDDLGLWLPNNGVPSTTKPADWYFIPLSPSNPISQWTTVPAPVHYQCGSSIGVPLTGNFTATTLWPGGARLGAQTWQSAQRQDGDARQGDCRGGQSQRGGGQHPVPALRGEPPPCLAGRIGAMPSTVKTTAAPTVIAKTPSVSAVLVLTGTNLNLNGTVGNDTISLVPGKTPGAWTLTINGVARSIGLHTTALNIDGLGGSNTITIVGTGKSEDAEIWPDHLVFQSGSLTVTATHVANISIRGGGNDEVRMHDVPGKNSFVSNAGLAKLLRGRLFRAGAEFRQHASRATPGAVDTANIYQSSSQNTLSNVGNVVAVSGAGTSTQVEFFNQVQVRSKSGAVVKTYAKPTGAVRRPDTLPLTKLAVTAPAVKVCR